MQAEIITGYSFHPRDLKVSARTPGISAYLRTRNGADFIEDTIRSHIEFYDEIVVVYNQCEDDTADIVARLAQEFTPKIRLFHYTDRVQPLGSKGHAKTPGDSPQSMVNFSNLALVKTRHQTVIKLDDDHLAIPDRVADICAAFREGRADTSALHCISGLNIARGAQGELGIPAAEPVSGNGDIGYFRMAEDTFFFHDRRFERFGRGKLKRIFAGYLYWHMKFLKTGDGFRNYELVDNPESRFARKRVDFEQSPMLSLPAAVKAMGPTSLERLSAKTGGKLALNLARDKAVKAAFPDATLKQALDRLSPGWHDVPGLGTPRG
ncbi:MAG: glycosyltransferase family 2 protein [Alphaproteobacteria bacterium]|nr:glycosyltransferase family 2 protein [Alphaproteobacteria bacterium]